MSLSSPIEDPHTLAERIAQLVTADTCGRIHKLRVEVQAGCVVISGYTPTYYNKQLATHAALKAASAVQNEIEVNVEPCLGPHWPSGGHESPFNNTSVH